MDDFSWCEDCDEVEKSNVPMTSSRGYCLNTWSSVEMEGNPWKKGIYLLNCSANFLRLISKKPLCLYTN